MISQNTFKYGAIVGLVGVFIGIVMYLMGPTALTNSQYSWAIFAGITGLIYLVIHIVLALRIRKDEGGTIKFLPLFVNLMIIIVISLVIDKAFGWILFGLIDPEFLQISKEAVMN
ncbi:MAG: DUF4199 family protein, partial [Luteibaculum sp.]